MVDGLVDMYYRIDGVEKVVNLETGELFYAEVVYEYATHPRVASQILVIEKEGTV